MMKKTFLKINILRFIAVIQCVLLIGAFGLANAFGGTDYGAPVWSKDGVSVYSDGGKISGIDDLFGLKTKELKPGDKREISILLENKSGDTYAFYLNARALTDEAAREREKYFTGKTANDLLLERIDISVFYEKRNIYSGKLIGHPDAEMYKPEGVPLGVIGPNGIGNIEVSIVIPGKEIDNSFMDTLCTVDWWFTARQEPWPTTPLPTPQPSRPDTPSRWPGSGYTGGGGIPDIPSGTGVDNFITIGNNETPLGSAEEDSTLTFEGENTPLGQVDGPDLVVVVDVSGKLPQTGGMRTFVIPAMITLSLLLALLAITYKKDIKK